MGCILIGTLLAAVMVFLGIIAPKYKKLATAVYFVFFSVVGVVFLGFVIMDTINGVNTIAEMIWKSFLIVALFFVLLAFHKQFPKRVVFFYVAFFSVLLAVTFSFASLSGYEEAFEIDDSVELTSIVVGDSNDFYIYESEDAYYYYKKGSYIPIELLKEGNEVQIIEQSDCEKAKLEKQRFNAKKSFWTWDTGYKIEYVFYVPEGAVVKNE